METKVCTSCGRELPIEKFSKTRWGGLRNVCSECMAAKNKETRKKTKMQQ